MSENLKYIYFLDSYKSQLPPEISSNSTKLYEKLLATDISEYIDKEKVKSNFNSSSYTIEQFKSLINDKFIFAQIINIRNIAISNETTKMKEYDNLDDVDEDDNDNEINLDNNKYLQGEETNHNKIEKIYYKIGLSSNGEDLFYGFEFDQFSNEIVDKLSSIKGPSFMKVLIGPKIEVRRGIFFLNNTNFKILSK